MSSSVTPSFTPPTSAVVLQDGPRGRCRVNVGPSTVAKCYLSVIIPAFNEESRLPETLARVDQYLSAREFSHEIIVVDDGSRDGTRQVVREFAVKRPWVRLVSYDTDKGAPCNCGKGFAVRMGVQNSVGRDVLFSDADLSTPIEEMEKLLPSLSRGDCDVAIASRGLPESDLAQHQPFYREWMGKSFNRLVQMLVVSGIQDTQCGFKAFRGEVAQQLFGLAQVDGFGFDTEILFLAKKFGYVVKEIPVTWRHKGNSRVNPLSTPLSMFTELLEVRLNDLRGLYDGGANPKG